MKIKIRRSCQSDLDKVFDLHTKCFSQSDHWYKSNIRHYLDDGIVVETKDSNKIIGILLQGYITPCNQNLNVENSSTDFSSSGDIYSGLTIYGPLELVGLNPSISI